MIKVRVIPQLLLADGLMKKPVRFTTRRRTIGNPISIARVFEARQVDELILIDIGCALHNKNVNPTIVAQISEEMTVPLAVGGGVRNIETVSGLIGAGAEKVVINTAAFENPNLIEQVAKKYGSQCIVVSIDANKNEEGKYEVFTHNGSKPVGVDPVLWAREAQERGAGELLINAIQQDGTMEGYDIDLVSQISNTVDIPVVAAGGAGSAEDCAKVIIEGGASAVIVGSLFHFRRITPNMVKEIMREQGIPVRLPKS